MTLVCRRCTHFTDSTPEVGGGERRMMSADPTPKPATGRINLECQFGLLLRLPPTGTCVGGHRRLTSCWQGCESEPQSSPHFHLTLALAELCLHDDKAHDHVERRKKAHF